MADIQFFSLAVVCQISIRIKVLTQFGEQVKHKPGAKNSEATPSVYILQINTLSKRVD